MPPANDPVLHFARTNFHGGGRLVGIRTNDRMAHVFALGRTGTGKSTMAEIMMRGDLAAGRGFALIDPHGDLAESVHRAALAICPNRVIYFDATDPRQPFGYNPLRRVREDRIPLVVSGLLETMRKLWPLAWGVKMEHLLRCSLYALLERDDATLPNILRLYADDEFRRAIVRQIRNPVVRRFWTSEWDKTPWVARLSWAAPVQNKLSGLLADPRLYRILVEPTVDLRFRSIMDEGKVLIVNLSKGQIGEDATLLLGSLLVSTIGLAAYSRANLSTAERRPFFLYVDEVQHFATLSLAQMLSEMRKGSVSITALTQHLHQLEPDIRHALLGNIGTLIVFRVGAEDAPLLAREFGPIFGVEDLMNLANRDIYLKLMINGAPSRPFSARTLSRSSRP